ncbi:hypothetical protein [Phytopseudomonas dryadis]|uniref:hypothetical protein n=1 Tax=Phytopseudomonas dryadis TaxID=2487520 RepID=UPI001038496D|nr:hypothetical protein [Pseudomonas dryadis]
MNIFITKPPVVVVLVYPNNVLPIPLARLFESRMSIGLSRRSGGVKQASGGHLAKTPNALISGLDMGKARKNGARLYRVFIHYCFF